MRVILFAANRHEKRWEPSSQTMIAKNWDIFTTAPFIPRGSGQHMAILHYLIEDKFNFFED